MCTLQQCTYVFVMVHNLFFAPLPAAILSNRIYNLPFGLKAGFDLGLLLWSFIVEA